MMNMSEQTSMIITAFCFMVLMLVITAPAAGTGQIAGINPGPVPGHYIFAGMPPVPIQPLSVAGPGDYIPILTWLQDRFGV
jgi:hypothetical protein